MFFRNRHYIRSGKLALIVRNSVLIRISFILGIIAIKECIEGLPLSVSAEYILVAASEPSSTRPPVAGRVSEVRAVIRQNGVDLVWNSVSEIAQEVCCDPARRIAVKFNERELRRPINANEEIEPALDSLHFGDIDMEEADRSDLELPFGDLLTPDIRQATAAMTLQAAVQG